MRASKRVQGILAAVGAALLIGRSLAACDKVILASNSISTSARAPSVGAAYARSVYLIKTQELAFNGLLAGTVFSTIGWSYGSFPGFQGTGGLKVYLQNAPDIGMGKNTDWATAISDMTIVHNAMTTLPNTTGPFTFTLSGGSAFTYTGGALYVAFDWQYTGPLSSSVVVSTDNTVANALLGAQSNTSPPTTTTASNFRPYTIVGALVPHHDAGVDSVGALGALPLSLIGNPVQNVRATVTNYGDSAMNVPVTLHITGAESFSDTKMKSLSACGGAATVVFADFSPSVEGRDSITVELPDDDFAGNNVLVKTLDVTPDSYSYKHADSSPTGGTGITSGTGEVVARFTTAVATQLDAVTIEFFEPTSTAYRLIVRAEDAGGGVGPPIYTDSSDRGVYVPGPITIRLPQPIPVGPGSFFAGIWQRNEVSAGLSYDREVPLRSGLFYYAPDTPGGSWTDFSISTRPYQLNIGAVLGSCLSAMTVSLSSGSASVCAGGGVALHASVSGGVGPYSYQWTENDVEVLGQTSASFTPTKSAPGGPFSYNCKVTDNGGCIDVQPSSAVSVTWLPEGASCSDGNGCTVSDACSLGSCIGTPITAPLEITGLRISTDKQTLVWDTAAGAGPGTVHDVSRGRVEELPVGSGASEVCLVTVSEATTTDAAAPGAGAAFWYLVRGRNGCGTGPYGATSGGAPRITNVCP